MSLSSSAAILTWHRRRYPRLLAPDIYKLIHQAVFGPGHMIPGATAARKSLAGELRSLKASGRRPNAEAQRSDDELLEPIDPRERLVRVNLRPLVARDGGMENCEWLVVALVESAELVEGDPMLMRRRLAAAVRWCRQNMPVQAERLEQLATRAGKSGYPAFHHSPAYQRAYRPAYRVILSSFLRRPRVSGRVC